MISLANEYYPSRNIRETVLARRREPVVWSNKAPPSCISKDAVNHYQENGFVVLPNLISGKLLRILQQEMHDLREQYKGSRDEVVISEPDSNTVRTLFNLPSISQVFDELSRHPALLSFARHVLDSEVYLHQTRLNYKSGFDGKEFYWHSDFETWHVEDGMPAMRAVSCSVLLTDNNEFNGPLLVIPESHKTYVGCVGETPDDNFKSSLKTQQIGTPSPESLSMLTKKAGGLESIKGAAGSVIFFDSNLLHGSAGNISPFARANVFMVYNSVENKLGSPLHGLKPRPEYLAHRQQVDTLTPIQ